MSPPVSPPTKAWLKTTGARILLEGAVASNPFGHQDPLSPSSWWAVFRYYWAFATRQHKTQNPKTGLCLGDITGQVRNHHRTALSEQLGLGVGILVARKVLTEQFPGARIQAIDAEAALANPRLVPGLDTPKHKMRPDIILMVDGGPLTVLECKGSRSIANRTSAMARAMRQVASLTFNGKPPSGLVVHTSADTDTIKASVLDPPGSSAWETPATRGGGAGVDRRAFADRVDGVGWLRADAEDLLDVSLLAWAGAGATALSLLPKHVITPPTEHLRDLETTEQTVGNQRCRGVESRIEIGGERFLFFRGIEASLFTALEKRQAGGSREGVEAASRAASDGWANSPVKPSDDEVAASSPSGAVTRLTAF
ncbi:MAG: hypothetical protein WBB83_16140 [Candidatus Microthrix parvicella]